MDLNIDGNAALVTASSSGLGKASARALAREGANVVVNGRDEDRLEDAVRDIREDAAGDVVGQAGDLTVSEDLDALVERTVSEFGGIDHLVTSAGGPPSGPALEISDEQWYTTFDMLVMSVVRLARKAEDDLRSDGGGTIVNITSTSVKEAIENLVLSNSVRMSVIGLEKTLSRELAPDIRVNAVLPGPIETQRIQDLIEQAMDRDEFDSYEEGMASWSDGIPVERIGNPMELGDTVAYLSSPRASFINGAALPIDGGDTHATL